MVPVAPIITCITSALIFHMRRISIMRSLYLKIFSASFMITFLSPGIATSIHVHVPCLLPRIIMSSLLLEIISSVRIWYHNMANLPSLLASNYFGTWILLLLLFVIEQGLGWLSRNSVSLRAGRSEIESLCGNVCRTP